MAMTGAHIQCGFSEKIGTSTIFYPIWSETIASGGSTSQVARSPTAPTGATLERIPIFRVKAPSANEIYAAVGVTPDATIAVSTGRQTARTHLSAGETIDLPAEIGEKVTVVAVA